MNQSSPDDPGDVVLVTIIMPVFNTPSNLVRRAVASALHQHHGRVELLIVDDGSAHEVALELDRISETDARVRVVHRSNRGVAAARNDGIRNAKGEYVAFLDADDFLEPFFISNALDVARATRAEIVFGGIRIVTNNATANWRSETSTPGVPLIGTSRTITQACVLALADSPSPSNSTNVLSTTNVVGALYSIHVARETAFREGMSHAEDRLYNVCALLFTDRVTFHCEPWYVYDQTHASGATRQISERMLAGLITTVREFAKVRQQLDQSNLPDRVTGPVAAAAAKGTLNYLKVLAGVMSLVGSSDSNHQAMRALLHDGVVQSALRCVTDLPWKDRIFTFSASPPKVTLLLLLGKIWARMEAAGKARHGGPPSGLETKR